jgi:hypothetical protein
MRSNKPLQAMFSHAGSVTTHTPAQIPSHLTAANFKAARAEYEEHRAACHSLDCSGRNWFEAEFYPPVAKLTGDIQKFSDSEIRSVHALAEKTMR